MVTAGEIRTLPSTPWDCSGRQKKFELLGKMYRMFWMFWSNMDFLGAGRYPNGFVSKCCFRWASGEPVTTILDPKQAPGQCPLGRLNLQIIAIIWGNEDTRSFQLCLKWHRNIAWDCSGRQKKFELFPHNFSDFLDFLVER